MMPLVISSGPRSLMTAAAASTYYADGGIASIVVRPRGCASGDHRFATGSHFLDDEALAGFEEVKSFLEERRAIMMGFNRAPGWFLQQFIKLAAVKAIGAKHVFIADGDTIFSRVLLDTVLRDPKILTTGEKFANYDRLLTVLGLSPLAASCVANGNVFSPEPLVLELATAAGFCAIMEDHVLASGGALDFSEYQITGSLLGSKLGIRRIRMFRRFDLLAGDAGVPQAMIERALRRYDAVAIEANHHRSLLKHIAARLLYMAGRSW